MKRIIFLSISILSCICQCTEEKIKVRDYTRLQTNPVSDINSSGATFSAQIIYDSNSPISETGFVWSISNSPTLENSNSELATSKSGNEFSATVKRGMSSGEVYYVRGYLRTVDYLVYGDVISFTSAGSQTPYTITHISPNTHVLPHSRVIVYGNFESNVKVKFNDQLLDKSLINEIKKNQITITLPDLTKNTNKVTLVLGEKEIEGRDKLTIPLTPLLKKEQYDTDGSSSMCVVGSKVYYSSYGTSKLRVLDLKSNTLSVKGTLPGFFPTSNSSFSINGTAYFGGDNHNYSNSRSFYAIDSTTNKFIRLDDLDENTTMAMGAIGGKGYRVTMFKTGDTYKNEFYEFDPNTNLWTRKADLPASIYSAAKFVEVNGKGYLALLQGYGWDGHYYAGTIQIWKYDPTTNQWTKLQIGTIRANARFGFVSTRNKVYLAYTLNADNEYNASFLEFDAASEKFSSTPITTRLPMTIHQTFSSNGIGYILSNDYLWQFDMAY